MAGNRIVAHRCDGTLVKGSTRDFLPTRDLFHVEPPGGGSPVAVRLSELKAIFFVRDYDGSPEHRDRNAFDPARPVAGRRIRVVFADGEVMVGTTQGYQPGRTGFFVVPADTRANTERCFVVAAATRDVTLL
jgi:hypothetical protein